MGYSNYETALEATRNANVESLKRFAKTCRENYRVLRKYGGRKG